MRTRSMAMSPGRIVYVNYGTPADYEQLQRMGVSVERGDCTGPLRRVVARH